jgi:hypothetical protein
MLDEGGQDPGSTDTSVRTNSLAPLLGLASMSSTLRSLALTVGEQPDAAMAAALEAHRGLTRLQLRFDADDGWGAREAARFDCRLVAGMKKVEELSVDHAEQLESAASLARLPALRKLCLGRPASLPAVAPHLPHLTSLELPSCTATALRDNEIAACAALNSLTTLRSLVLGGSKRFYIGGAALESAAASHAQAMAALPALLPQGCELLAEAPCLESH